MNLKFLKGSDEEMYNDVLLENLGLVIKRPTAHGRESQEITALVKSGKIVAFSLENLAAEEALIVYTYIEGACNVLGGSVEKITDKVYVSVPRGIKIEKDSEEID